MQDVWPNIYVVYSSNQRGLKYYLVVNSGGEYGAINLKYHGAESLYVDGNDALVIESSIGELVQPQAIAYEMDAYGELSVLGWQPEYDVSGDEVTFLGIGSYSGRLVFEVNWGYVDAVAGGGSDNLEWSTYFGGTQDDWILDMTQSPDGDLFVGGKTKSTDWPFYLGTNIVTNLSHLGQEGFAAGFDQYDVLKWFTYLGGSSDDAIQSLAFNQAALTDKLFFVGWVASSDFGAMPVSDPGNGTYYEGASAGGKDGWIGRIDHNLGHLTYGAYLGGDNADEARSVACDVDGNVFVVGNTKSSTGQANSCLASSGNQFPLCDPGGNSYFQSSYHGAQDIFLVKLDKDNFLKWATFYGSNAEDEVFEVNVAVDPISQLSPGPPTILICGRTTKQSTGSNACGGSVPATEFPLCDHQSSYFQAGTGAFLSRFTQDGELIWSSNFNNIREFQTLTSSHDYYYAVGVIPETSTSVGLDGNCGPLSGNNIPICDANGGYSQDGTGVELYVVKLEKTTDALYWSTLYGTDARIDFDGTYLLTGPVPNSEPHPKYLDAVVSEDDFLFILGASLEEFDCYLDPSFTNWFYQSDNASWNPPTSSQPLADAFILGFSETQSRKWSTLFGGGNGTGATTYFDHPLRTEFGSAAMLREKKLFIAGYAGGGGTTHPHPLRDEGVQPTGNAYYHDGTGTCNTYYALDGMIAKFDVDQMLLTSREDGIDGAEGSLRVYPNPTSYAFDMALPANVSICRVSVLDLAGKVVVSDILYSSDSGPIVIDQLPAGMYLVRIGTESETHVVKLIKR